MGSDDTALLPKMACCMQFVSTSLKFMLLEEAGHFLVEQRPQEIVSAVLDHINGVVNIATPTLEVQAVCGDGVIDVCDAEGQLDLPVSETVPTPEPPALISGVIELTVADPATFIASEDAVAGIAGAVAERARVAVESVTVTLALARRLRATNGRRLEGGVVASYEITGAPQSARAAIEADVSNSATMLEVCNRHLEAAGNSDLRVTAVTVAVESQDAQNSSLASSRATGLTSIWAFCAVLIGGRN